MTEPLFLSDPYRWVDPADAVFVGAVREQNRMQAQAWEACHAERLRLQAALTVKDAWRPMKTAHLDGRHILLRPDPEEDWSDYDWKLWHGGVVAEWRSDDDQWWVRPDPRKLQDGEIIPTDSRWFSGWKPLPDELYDEAAP